MSRCPVTVDTIVVVFVNTDNKTHVNTRWCLRDTNNISRTLTSSGEENTIENRIAHYKLHASGRRQTRSSLGVYTNAGLSKTFA